MPRIPQYAVRYAAEDFWKEINRCCPTMGIQSENAAALGREIGVDGRTLRNYKARLGTMRFDVLQKLIAALRPDPAVILKTLGYSEKEIRAFVRASPYGRPEAG